MREILQTLSFSKIVPPFVGVPFKKYVEDIPGVHGEVHANLCPDPFCSLGGEWEQTHKLTDRHTFLLYTYRPPKGSSSELCAKNIHPNESILPLLGSRGEEEIHGAEILVAQRRSVLAQAVSFLPTAKPSGPRTVSVVVLILVAGESSLLIVSISSLSSNFS